MRTVFFNHKKTLVPSFGARVLRWLVKTPLVADLVPVELEKELFVRVWTSDRFTEKPTYGSCLVYAKGGFECPSAKRFYTRPICALCFNRWIKCVVTVNHKTLYAVSGYIGHCSLLFQATAIMQSYLLLSIVHSSFIL